VSNEKKELTDEDIRTLLKQGFGNRLDFSSVPLSTSDHCVIFKANIREPAVGFTNSTRAYKVFRTLKDVRGRSVEDVLDRLIANYRDIPGIVRIHSKPRLSNGLLAIEMDFVEGKTLAEFLKDAKPTYQQACDLVYRICLAVSGLHQAGLIHRDLTPSNMIVGLNQEVVIIDLDLVRLHADFASERSPLDWEPAEFLKATSHVTNRKNFGSPIGTPAYASPEQMASEDGLVTTHADQYSVGTILYELLAGKMPFEETNFLELYGRKIRDLPSLPNVEEIPTTVRNILLKMIAPAKEGRFSSLLEAAKELRKFFDSSTWENERNAASRAKDWLWHDLGGPEGMTIAFVDKLSEVYSLDKRISQIESLKIQGYRKSIAFWGLRDSGIQIVSKDLWKLIPSSNELKKSECVVAVKRASCAVRFQTNSNSERYPVLRFRLMNEVEVLSSLSLMHKMFPDVVREDRTIATINESLVSIESASQTNRESYEIVEMMCESINLLRTTFWKEMSPGFSDDVWPKLMQDLLRKGAFLTPENATKLCHEVLWKGSPTISEIFRQLVSLRGIFLTKLGKAEFDCNSNELIRLFGDASKTSASSFDDFLSDFERSPDSDIGSLIDAIVSNTTANASLQFLICEAIVRLPKWLPDNEDNPWKFSLKEFDILELPAVTSPNAQVDVDDSTTIEGLTEYMQSVKTHITAHLVARRSGITSFAIVVNNESSDNFSFDTLQRGIRFNDEQRREWIFYADPSESSSYFPKPLVIATNIEELIVRFLTSGLDHLKSAMSDLEENTNFLASAANACKVCFASDPSQADFLANYQNPVKTFRKFIKENESWFSTQTRQFCDVETMRAVVEGDGNNNIIQGLTFVGQTAGTQDFLIAKCKDFSQEMTMRAEEIGRGPNSPTRPYQFRLSSWSSSIREILLNRTNISSFQNIEQKDREKSLFLGIRRLLEIELVSLTRPTRFGGIRRNEIVEAKKFAKECIKRQKESVMNRVLNRVNAEAAGFRSVEQAKETLDGYFLLGLQSSDAIVELASWLENSKLHEDRQWRVKLAAKLESMSFFPAGRVAGQVTLHSNHELVQMKSHFSVQFLLPFCRNVDELSKRDSTGLL